MKDRGKPAMAARCLALALLAFTFPATGQGRADEIVRKTIRGEVRTGTLDSSVGDYSFLTRSQEAAKIFQTCKMDDECQVEADVRGEGIVRVRSVKLVRKAGETR